MSRADATFGVFLPFYAFKEETRPDQLFTRLKAVVLECERLGFHSIWIDDHLMHGTARILECWSTLAALAAVTTRVRLGTMVTPVSFRNPALLAKAAATVDNVSGGRLEFGVGAGVQGQEHEAFGFTFPPLRDRVERLGEAVEIVKSMWTKQETSFKGKYYRVNGAVCEPKPLQKPHPPITIGGAGETLTLKVTAKYADRADFGYLPSAKHYARKLQVLQDHCKAVGRAFGEIGKSCWPTGQIILAESNAEAAEKARCLKPEEMSQADFDSFTFAGTPEEFSRTLGSYEEVGATHFMLYFAELPDTASLQAFAHRFLKRAI